MTQTDLAHAAELERQKLVKEYHSLIVEIASRPGLTKLLRGVIPNCYQKGNIRAFVKLS